MLRPPTFFEKRGLFVQLEFLNESQCTDISTEMVTAEQEPAWVFDHSKTLIDINFRRAYDVEPSPTIQDLLQTQFQAVLPQLSAHFELELTQCSPPQFMRYTTGDFLKAHRDTISDSQRQHERLVSAIVFVNSHVVNDPAYGYEGGQFLFYDLMDNPAFQKIGFPVQPARGLLIAFPSHLRHEVKPILKGERYSIFAWYGGNPRDKEGSNR